MNFKPDEMDSNSNHFFNFFKLFSGNFILKFRELLIRKTVRDAFRFPHLVFTISISVFTINIKDKATS